MADLGVIIVASFLLAFKAILVEGTEVAVLALATVRQLGKRNVFTGVLIGVLGSVVVFAGVRQVFLLLPEIVIDFATGAVLLYFSSRFLRGFLKYSIGKKSFREKMEKMSHEVVEKDLARYGDAGLATVPFSFTNSLPVLAITLTEGFEASLVLAAAGTFNLEWTLIGAAASIALLVVVSAISYDYLLRVPRWFIDLLAGSVLLTFGLFFVVSGVLAVLYPGT
jgi:uncharacterized membrane protein